MSDIEGWRSSPDTRGTIDILWSCLSTLALCVWTAIHPNIPVVYKFWPVFFDRLGLMGLAIVFPEIIITAAWSQRRRGQSLLADVNRSFGYLPKVSGPKLRTRNLFKKSPYKSPNDSIRQTDSPLTTYSGVELVALPASDNSRIARHHQWDLDRALFGVMGGYAMETRYHTHDGEEHILRRLVTADGISILARIGELPAITLNDIEERSKADIFAKSIVVGQIIWFALQVFGRLGRNLPVTPLETHTAIHVGCTILVYIIWFHKPYNLTQSIVVKGPQAQNIGALFSFHDISRDVYRQQWHRYEDERIEYWKTRVIQASRGDTNFSSPPQAPVSMGLRQALQHYKLEPNLDAPDKLRQDIEILHALAENATQGLHYIESRGCSALDHPSSGNLKLLRDSAENFAIRSVWGGWSSDIGHEPSLAKGIHVLFNVLYGGSHLAAWSSFFPSTVESWLWRCSALFLTTVPLWGLLWILWWRGL
ncbi:hypothetical protein P170DRAFT_426646 [Aspergillus steynii IBT 23096]|uniref:Uncharacterized protein n=1 Tax=Aspergillus steynii IBT 23096 TaxID=1392250 RepID=A0A2I2GA82_9EURO|nr:uncharacterized protein P170DRAFT_426646 [Aspergillus steynii IBT 23096]PLB49778.1 hypothetical protein P170DRAFT_426646 [Aspergillus steynii IBT 23096]